MRFGGGGLGGLSLLHGWGCRRLSSGMQAEAAATFGAAVFGGFES